MADKSTPRGTPIVPRNVTPFTPGERMFYIECEMLIPHRFLVAVPAPNSNAACVLAENVINAGKAYGIPDFVNAERFTVRALRSGCAHSGKPADKIEAIPAAVRVTSA